MRNTAVYQGPGKLPHHTLRLCRTSVHRCSFPENNSQPKGNRPILFRHTLTIIATAALTLSLGASAGSAAPRPLPVDNMGVVAGGYLYDNFDNKGPHATASTRQAQPCGVVYTSYNVFHAENQRNVYKNHPCWRTFPDGTDSPIGVGYVYPKNIASMSKLPVLLYTPAPVLNPA